MSLCADSLNVLFPIPMGGPGYAALALLVFAILSWCLMLAPIAVTALAVLVLLPFTGLMDFGQVVATGFGDSTFAFFSWCSAAECRLPEKRLLGAASRWSFSAYSAASRAVCCLA